MAAEQKKGGSAWHQLLREEADFVSYIVIRIRTVSADRNGKPIRLCQKQRSAKSEIWTAETLMHALEVCDDDRLKLALKLAFSCSLRMGEMLGLP